MRPIDIVGRIRQFGLASSIGLVPMIYDGDVNSTSVYFGTFPFLIPANDSCVQMPHFQISMMDSLFTTKSTMNVSQLNINVDHLHQSAYSLRSTGNPEYLLVIKDTTRTLLSQILLLKTLAETLGGSPEDQVNFPS